MNASDTPSRSGWLLGYFSLIYDTFAAPASATSRRRAAPCLLHNWCRDWSSVRTLTAQSTKRYVDASTFDPIRRFGFSNARPQAGSRINGVAVHHDADDWAALCFREAGYHLVEITGDVECYPGFDIDGPVFLFVDDEPDDAEGAVSATYINMGLQGATLWEDSTPGFRDDFLRSTGLPKAGIFDGYFLFLGADGRSIWLLDELGRSQTCLLLMPHPMIPGRLVRPDQTPEWQAPSSPRFARYDIRNRCGTGTGIDAGNPVLETLRECLENHPTDFLRHPAWIVRLGALTRLHQHPQLARELLHDPDPWVATQAALSLR